MVVAGEPTPGAPVDSGDAIRAGLLERLERQINLPAWLVAHGFHVAPVQPDRTEIAMSDRYGEAIRVRKDPERAVWSYSSPDDPADRGSVVDLLVRRDGSTLDACVNRLAACFDRSNRSAEAVAYREALLDREDILHRAEARHLAALKVEQQAARDLEHLGVAKGALDEGRFGRPSTILRNPTRLEHSQFRQTDRELVLLERPIDAVAYEKKHGGQHACYLYLGDHPDLDTRRRVAHVLADAPEHIRVVLAFARDTRGHELAAEVARLAPTRQFDRRPPEFGSRWADQMQLEHRHQRSLARDGRSAPDLEAFRKVAGHALEVGVDPADIRTAIVRRRRNGLDR
jgi:hypothetical protein